VEGLQVARDLAEGADVLIENFRPGALDRLGLSYEQLAKVNPRLIYCSEKGFLPGPYEQRTALDEVAQMMGGLAYMTGPPGRPLRAGSSVIDVTGGMFGVIGILAALEERHRTGRGQKVVASLFETTIYLVGQHMAQFAVTGKAAAPMPARISAWAIYDVFDTATPDEQLFVGVVSDAQWVAFCAAFGLDALGADPRFARNNQRVLARDEIVPQIRALFGAMPRAELIAKVEAIGLPFAPIARPEDLFDDAHLNAGGLIELTLPDGRTTKLPGLPVELDGARLELQRDIPRIGADSDAVLAELGYGAPAIAELRANGGVA
jgi:crotonobetainyl-CoA:carnitine CoA-transferase CaiB-like acyl-CoA transferase